jgi:uncharacterized protein YggE
VKRPLLALPALALPALLLAGCAGGGSGQALAAPSEPDHRPAVTAQGTGQVRGKPDILDVVLGVETRAAAAQAALRDNNERTAALVDMLKRRGVAQDDIRTSQLSISPTFDDKGQRITGYQVHNLVTATLRDLAGAGALIDAAAQEAGDTIRVEHIAFAIDDDSALMAQARDDAVRRARAQAEQMAKAAGVRLGRVRSISEAQAGPSPVTFDRAAGAPEAAAPVPLEPGTEKLTLTVTVVYDIEG